MKTKHCIITLLAIAISPLAHANLVDLTPGGTPIDYGPPSHVAQYGFYDSAAFGYFDSGQNSQIFLKGWVSSFGILNGGTHFFTDLFLGSSNPTSSNVWWDFTGTGYAMLYIDVSGNGLSNLYQVTHGDTHISSHSITIDGITEITQIAFYGRNPALPIPDTGSTLSLFGLSILALCGLKYEAQRRRNA